MLETFFTTQGAIALLTLIVFSALIYAKKIVNTPTLIIADAFGLVVFLAGGIASFTALLVFFVVGEALTRIARKKEKHEQRTYLNIIGNAGAGILMLLIGFPMGFFGSMAAALGDTLSSEIGMLSANKPVLITNLKKVEKGTDGGVTSLGFFANLFGAAIIALIYFLGVKQSLLAAGIIIIAGLCGGITDSVLGAVFERKGRLGNNEVNFLASLFGALTALALSAAFLG